jgi:radical SAM superfamily enzyme YgiQ (UPF0313 family)
MATSYDEIARIKARLERETGTVTRRGGRLRVALVYPSPYTVGMSSLGFQTIYRIINTRTEHLAERAFLPDDLSWDGPLLTYESLSPVGDFEAIAFSVSYELEITGVIECLQRAGLEPLASRRRPTDPLVVMGGPLTFSNPLPLAPFVDVMVMGEAEHLIGPLLDEIASWPPRDELLGQLAEVDGLFVPSLHGDRLPPIAKADDALLPAFSQIITPDTELSDMFLVEPERGCHRRCSFCVMRRSTNGGMRTVSPERVLETIPREAPRVGLVGAAVTDHPGLVPLVRAIVESGRGIGISSLRADRLTPELTTLLREGGYQTLTVAADGASERLRKLLLKAIRHYHLRHAAELAASSGFRCLKLYMMFGVPSETDDDIDELVELATDLAQIVPLVFTVSPFVAKRNTPLDETAFGGVDVVNRRLKRFRRALKGRAEIRSPSARWAWVEYCLAQGGPEMAQAALLAHGAGGSFSAWRKAVEAVAPDQLRFLRRAGARDRLEIAGG